jgi:hypothetical protein
MLALANSAHMSTLICSPRTKRPIEKEEREEGEDAEELV